MENENIFNFFANAISHLRVSLNWKKVAENDVGNYYIDFDSLKNENGLIYYTDLVDFIEPSRTIIRQLVGMLLIVTMKIKNG